MARRFIHYEAAFEDYLRSLGWPYVPVDEKRKVIFAGSRVKSFDFLVYPPGGSGWLVDIKGRKFPYEIGGSTRYWENWVTAEDLEGLDSWQGVFGAEFQAMFVFAYWLLCPLERIPNLDVHRWRGQEYAFLSIRAADYAAHARRRSDKWDTVSMPAARFREHARPIAATPALRTPPPAYNHVA